MGQETALAQCSKRQYARMCAPRVDNAAEGVADQMFLAFVGQPNGSTCFDKIPPAMSLVYAHVVSGAITTGNGWRAVGDAACTRR